MKEGNVTYEKAYAFAVRIIRLYQYLKAEKKEFDLARQLLRSGT
jgi:four helix bundle protein